ncbi:MAG: tripartite tricarboxylate transporter TctB family protein [Proteobacteria bacterium]|nr:tripartite tricarboxylate transporter TctB family protein [Pseudomonadota bacterium]
MRKSKDLIPALFLLMLATFAFVLTFYFPEVATWSTSTPATDRFSVTGATWPRIVLCVIFFLLILLVILSVLKKTPIAHEKIVEEAESEKNLKPAIAFVLILFCYLFLMEILGFPLDTILFGFVFCLTIGRKELNVGKGCLISFIISILIVLIFSRYLYLPLPKGTWIFRAFSEFVMF